ncbi:MAG: Rieske (2Fe-2S) protein [Clostridia bacterium]|nr:Rieske (2Fe-2S) protein [Clostridia bacterium]
MRATGTGDDDREAAWVEEAAEAFAADRRPPRPRTARERALLRVMAALRAGRRELPEPSPEFRARVEALVREAAGEEPAWPPAAQGARGRREGVTRRELLRWAGVAALLATAASVGADWILDRLGAGRGEGARGGWREAAQSAEVAEGAVVYRDVAGESLFLVRRGGRVRALSAFCTHMPCLLHADPAAGQLVCPCHGARFDLAGRSLPSTYALPLPSLPEFPAREADGRILVWIG